MASQVRSVSAFTAFRIGFGIVWIIDGLMKFVFMQPSDVVGLVQGAGQGQPVWLSGWFSFWNNAISANPAAFVYGIGATELALGLALVFGFMRKTAYLGGIILSLMIWGVDEGFGGPYGTGSTDIGAAIMYAFVFVGLIISERSAIFGEYSLDAKIAKAWGNWRYLSDLSHERQNPPIEPVVTIAETSSQNVGGTG